MRVRVAWMACVVWLAWALMGIGWASAGQPPAHEERVAEDPGREPPVLEAGLRARLEEIDRRAQAHLDLRAEFEQRKHTPLLRRPIVSSGTVRSKGSVALWETQKPRRTVMRIDEREIAIYDPVEGSMEVFPSEEGVRKLSATPQPSLGSVLERFAVEEIGAAEMLGGEAEAGRRLVALSMTPTDEELRRRVARVRVLLDAERALCVRMEVTDAEGERTEIIFKKIEVGVGLTEESLSLVVPKGTRVSRPLDGLSPSGGGSGGGTKR